MRLKSKRLISLLLAGSMMVSMLPASAVTAFAETTANNSVTSEATQNVAVTVDSFTTGNLEEAVRDAAKLQNVTDISQITKLTVSGGTLNKADFQFLSGVVVTGEAGASCTAEYAGAANASTETKKITYLKNLEELDLTDAQCENNTFPPRAFCRNTKIKVVIFPNTLQSSGFKTFAFASALEYVGTREGLGTSSEESTIKFPASMTKIGESCFYDDSNLKCTLELPATVTTLGTNAFEGSAVKADKILIRNTVTFEAPASGKEGAEHANTFYGTNIKSIELEEGITEIPNGFVGNCWELNSITIPSTVTKIGTGAFKCDATTKIKDTIFSSDLVIPDKVVSLGKAAIDNIGHVSNIIVENPNVTLGQYCFYYQSSKIYFTANDIENTNDYWDSNSTRLFTDGGKVTPNSTETYENTGLYIPVKNGYKFNGWYGADGTKLTTVAEAGKTYYAAYKTLHTVTFDDGVNNSTVKVADGETVAKPETDPKKDGNKFDGWYADKNCTAGNEFKFADNENANTITTNTTVYAKWTPYKTTVEPKVEANADPASKTVEITVNVNADPAELVDATATLNFTDANGNDDSANVTEVKVNGITVNKDADGSYTAKLNTLMQKASENGAEAVMLADVNEDAVVPSTVKGTARLTVTYKTPGKHRVGIVLNAANGDVICKETATVEIAPEPGTLNLTGCTAKLEDGTSVENGAKVPVGAEVTVTFEQDADSDLVLNGWNVTPETLTDTNGKLVKDITADTFTFVMPETDEGVTIAAVTKAKAAAPAEDDSLDAATVVTGVVLGTGTAILAYHIGTEVYAEQVLGKGVAIPRTREEVALKAWELAGKPAVELNGEPLSEAAQAEKWAVESGLMQNVDGSFNGSKKMSKLKALRTLDAAKKLG